MVDFLYLLSLVRGHAVHFWKCWVKTPYSFHTLYIFEFNISWYDIWIRLNPLTRAFQKFTKKGNCWMLDGHFFLNAQHGTLSTQLFIYFLYLPLLLTMNPHLHRRRWWQTVCPSSGAFLNFQKRYIPIEVRSLLLNKPVLGGTPVLPMIHLILGSVHRVYPYIVRAPRY